MYVEIRELDSKGKDVVVGRLTLDGDEIVAEPQDRKLLQSILDHPVHDFESGETYTARDNPKEFLRSLQGQYRSAYLRASAVRK